MHVQECFDLAFTRPAADSLDANVIGNPAVMDSNDNDENDMSFLADYSPTQLQQPQEELIQGSVPAMIHCIVAEWGTKSQTNFYIPPEHYPGYSYLFEDDKEFDKNIRHSVHHNIHSHLHEQSNRAFVTAEEPNNLHPHHYDVYTHGSVNSTHVPKMTLTAVHATEHHSISIPNIALHHPISMSQIMSNSNANHAMTVPYMHPHLEIPVPPLHLPWYFGALCFSFAFSGMVLLYFPHKWAQTHWFPLRKFALALILLQAPCSFLADYVNMTTISSWHTIDRFLACFMMLLEVVRFVCAFPYTRPCIYMLYLISIAGAVFCFMRSQKSQETLNEEGFIFWHCGWHLYPMACVVVYTVEVFLNHRLGEYYAFDCESDDDIMKVSEFQLRKGELGGILISTEDLQEAKKPSEATKDYTLNGMEGEEMQISTKSVESTLPNLTAASPTNTNGMATPSSRRSRRIAGQKPEVQASL